MFYLYFFTILSFFSLAFGEQQKSYNRLKNQVAIITGASKGIGKGISYVFAKEGAKVILVARSESLLKQITEHINKDIGEASYVIADMKDTDSLDKVIEETEKRYGRIDILCHNAGIYPEKNLENLELNEWHNVIDVNLTSSYYLVKKCIPIMKKQQRGKIIITSSISGPKTALPGLSHYTASKAGINGFIKTAAVELAKYNIQVNAVEPGNILTEGLEKLGESYLSNMKKAIPANRLGSPEDVAYAMLFLASKESDFITGQSLVVDGGQILPESRSMD